MDRSGNCEVIKLSALYQCNASSETCAKHLTYCENAQYSAAFKIFHLSPTVKKGGGEVASY